MSEKEIMKAENEGQYHQRGDGRTKPQQKQREGYKRATDAGMSANMTYSM